MRVVRDVGIGLDHPQQLFAIATGVGTKELENRLHPQSELVSARVL